MTWISRTIGSSGKPKKTTPFLVIVANSSGTNKPRLSRWGFGDSFSSQEGRTGGDAGDRKGEKSKDKKAFEITHHGLIKFQESNYKMRESFRFKSWEELKPGEMK